MTSAQICIIIAIAVYLIAMVFVGVAYSRASKGGTDSFYLGGRQLGPVVTAMSAEASDMSSWLLMGLPGVAYFTGIADAAWTAIGLALGTYLNFLLVAKRLRIYSAEINAITVPEFFSKRFKDDKKVLLGISALIILIFFIPYTASGFAAIGKLFNSLLKKTNPWPCKGQGFLIGGKYGERKNQVRSAYCSRNTATGQRTL